MMIDLKILEALCNEGGVSGDEGAVRELLWREIRDQVDFFKVDTMGNIIARKSAADEGKPRILIDAHMDEVGFMLVEHDSDGFYTFQKVGGIDNRILPGKKVLIGKDKLPGVISATPIHLTGSSERRAPISFDSMRIDTGGRTTIEPGTRAIFATEFRVTEDTIFAKAIDDRIGVASLVLLAKQKFENIDLWFSFSVQEEIGLRGAKVVARSIHPDAAIVVDATPAYDQPTYNEAENAFYNAKLGHGPAIYTLDSATVYDRRMVDYFAKVAKLNQIPLQFRQPGGGGTNAGAIYLTDTGIPTISISIPHRSTHSPISMSRLSDWENTMRLLESGLRDFTLEHLSAPRG